MRPNTIARVALLIGVCGLMLTLIRIVFTLEDNLLLRILAIGQAANSVALLAIVLILIDQGSSIGDG